MTKSTDTHPLYTSVKAYRAKDDPLSDEVSLEDRLRQHVPDGRTSANATGCGGGGCR